MQKWDMKSFKISDFKVHSDEKDVVVTSYNVTLEGTFDGKDASGTYNAGSVWKMENGKWLAIFHTNVQSRNSRPAVSASPTWNRERVPQKRALLFGACDPGVDFAACGPYSENEQCGGANG